MPETENQPRQEIVLPDSTRAEIVLDTVGTVSSLTPVLGGVISSILTGIAGDRRFGRIREVLIEVATQIQDLSDEQEEYVRSEDFEDLLVETTRRVAAERSDEKRRAYARILTKAVASGGEPGYDEQLRFLRVLEELQPDHLRVLRAMMQEPESASSALSGSFGATLERRLPDISSKERLMETRAAAHRPACYGSH